MKKILLLISVALYAMSASAQEAENYFDAADCDANGWLWFDTQAKIDKYIGFDGKKILLTSALYENNEGENPEPYAYATVKGAGTDADATLGGPNALTGAIVLCESNQMNSQTGGAILLQLPSCLSLSLSLSSEARMLTALYGAAGYQEVIDLALIQGKCAAPFSQLAKAGQYVYSNMELVENANTGLRLYSTDKVTACFRNCHSYPLFIHGIRLMVKKGDGGDQTTSAISRLQEEASTTGCYNLQGLRVDKPGKGLNVVNGRKVML